MKKLLLLVLPVLAVLTSCDNYGEKVAVGESEVFYKGDGVTQKDAQALGEFLKENELFVNDEKRSAQLLKEGNKYIVNLVVDKKAAAPSFRLNLWKLQSNLSNSVFAGADTRFSFTDDKFNNGDVLEATNVVKLGTASIYYDGGAIKKTDVQQLGEFLQAKGMLTEGKEADLLVRSESGAPTIRVIVDKAYMEENLELVLPAFGYWQHLVQNELPAFKKANLLLTSTAYEDYKKVPTLSAEELAQFEKSFAETTNATQTSDANITAAETANVPAAQEQE